VAGPVTRATVWKMESAEEERPTSAREARVATEIAVGWTVCGINGCVLADCHAGDCLFPEIEGARRRRQATSNVPDINAPQHL
jgi:hypothetical protein